MKKKFIILYMLFSIAVLLSYATNSISSSFHLCFFISSALAYNVAKKYKNMDFIIKAFGHQVKFWASFGLCRISAYLCLLPTTIDNFLKNIPFIFMILFSVAMIWHTCFIIKITINILQNYKRLLESKEPESVGDNI
ncbi:MAG: hypothetical protein RLZZ59_106 [Pseudomonadota bacterium]|jgi:hypothetical protein